MRHHLDPQRARASMSMAPGPSPTRFEDADPEYEPPRVIGSGLPSMFQSVIRAAADADTHSLDSSGCHRVRAAGSAAVGRRPGMTHRRPPSAPPPPMSDAHHAAITTELVRLTVMGGPDRRELLDRIEIERLARHRKYRTHQETR